MRASVRFLITSATAIVVCLTASTALAQGSVSTTTTMSSQQRHEGIGIGIKAGPLFSSLSSDAITDPLDTKTGWIGGLFIGGNRPGVVGVGVDVLYARKTVGTPAGNVNLDYVEIPVLLRVNAGSNSLSGVNVYGVVGPAFDWRLNGKLNFSQGVDDQTAGFDVGISAGAGVEITRFIIEGRYTQGFRSIAKDLSGSDKITSKSFAIMLGVRLN